MESTCDTEKKYVILYLDSTFLRGLVKVQSVGVRLEVRKTIFELLNFTAHNKNIQNATNGSKFYLSSDGFSTIHQLRFNNHSDLLKRLTFSLQQILPQEKVSKLVLVFNFEEYFSLRNFNLNFIFRYFSSKFNFEIFDLARKYYNSLLSKTSILKSWCFFSEFSDNITLEKILFESSVYFEKEFDLYLGGMLSKRIPRILQNLRTPVRIMDLRINNINLGKGAIVVYQLVDSQLLEQIKSLSISRYTGRYVETYVLQKLINTPLTKVRTFVVKANPNITVYLRHFIWKMNQKFSGLEIKGTSSTHVIEAWKPFA
eukprot:snap_masked-scaffold_36-processed-gene-1.27-mRNA-1 protein AED:1.00 eAED:1.00 QI:0/-1/0/0/-1/1/1/0/313